MTRSLQVLYSLFLFWPPNLPLWLAAAAPEEFFCSPPVNAAAEDEADEDEDDEEEENGGAITTSRCWFNLILCCWCCWWCCCNAFETSRRPAVPSWLHMSSWQHMTVVLGVGAGEVTFGLRRGTVWWWLLSHLKLSPLKEEENREILIIKGIILS